MPSAWRSRDGKRQRPKNVRWFEDRETGKHLDRPAFQKMQAAIFSGSIDTLSCGSLTAWPET